MLPPFENIPFPDSKELPECLGLVFADIPFAPEDRPAPPYCVPFLGGEEDEVRSGVLYGHASEAYLNRFFPVVNGGQGEAAETYDPAAPPSDDDCRRRLKEIWGYDDFRGIQLDIIRSILRGNDTLGLMPTGGGKSITFQLPAMMMPGVCLVVTPLISLMLDQVEHLLRRGIRAAAIHSGLSREEILTMLENAIFGAYKFLYVSPERLASELFLKKASRIPVSFIAVDEAHCISQWGYDFRPHYLRIAELRKILPCPVLALTATATVEVVDDVMERLAFRSKCVYRMSFARKNLRYVVRRADDKTKELLHILRSVPGSAVVYTRSRKGTRELAAVLNQEGIDAHFYHAGLSPLDKELRQKDWMAGRVRVMVATNAFGMGIDKPDVRLVAHMDLPDSVEAYFQEAGRAGRDGATAYAVLLFNKGDRTKMRRRIPDTFPEKDYVRGVYEKLCCFLQVALGDGRGVTYEFSLSEFCRRFCLFPVPVESALQLLTRAGYINYRDENDETVSRLMFLVTRDALYDLHFLPREEDRALRAVLRLYGGVFAEYVQIEEKRLAMVSGLTGDEVYEALKALTRRRVLHYVPRKRISRVTFTLRRLEREEISLMPDIYDTRREQYVRRVESILSYAETTGVCRSRLLLDYFSDPSAADCGHCDACVARRAFDETASAIEPNCSPEALAETYAAILADGTPRAVDALPHDGIPSAVHRAAVRLLVADGRVTLDPATMTLKGCEA